MDLVISVFVVLEFGTFIFVIFQTSIYHEKSSGALLLLARRMGYFFHHATLIVQLGVKH